MVRNIRWDRAQFHICNCSNRCVVNEGGTYTVRPMHCSQHLRPVLKIGSKDITQGKIDSHSQSKEEEGSNHHREGRRANNRNKTTGHQCLGDHQSSASAETPAERVNEEGRQDESNRIGDENERDNRISNIVMSEFMSMIRTAQ